MYPLRQVMKVAQTAIERDPADLDALIEKLHDDNEIVRYWAAQGIVMLREAGKPAAAALGARLDGDESVHVRVVAAEALANLDDARAVAFLAETLDTHEDRRVRLQALNALTYVPVAAVQPYAAVVDRATGYSDEYVANAARYLRAVLAGTYDPLAPP